MEKLYDLSLRHSQLTEELNEIIAEIKFIQQNIGTEDVKSKIEELSNNIRMCKIQKSEKHLIDDLVNKLKFYKNKEFIFND